MKIGFLADVHLGNHRRFGGPFASGLNERCRFALAAFERAVVAANDKRCAALVIAGDLFDTHRPEPQVLAATMRVLAKAEQDEVTIIVGNHDQQSSADGDHALGVLADHACIVQAPRTLLVGGRRCELVLVPFQAGAPSGWLPGVLDDLPYIRGPASQRLLVVHLGIEDDETEFFLRGAADSIRVDALVPLLEGHGIDAAFAGNWHVGIDWPGRPSVHQIGATVPTGFDNPGLDGYGDLVIYDTEAREVERVEIPGPRFLKITSCVELPKTPHPTGYVLYVEVTCAPADVARETVALAEAKALGLVHAGEVHASRTDARAKAATAALEVRKAGSLREAIDTFVAGMSLDEKVDRGRVAVRCRGFVKEGES